VEVAAVAKVKKPFWKSYEHWLASWMGTGRQTGTMMRQQGIKKGGVVTDDRGKVRGRVKVDAKGKGIFVRAVKSIKKSGGAGKKSKGGGGGGG
jgi:hypothetical protein